MTEETLSGAVSILSWLVLPLFDLDDHAFKIQFTSTKKSFVDSSVFLFGFINQHFECPSNAKVTRNNLNSVDSNVQCQFLEQP